MKAERRITAAASALGAVAFTVALAVIEPVLAQAPNIIWVASHPAPAGGNVASRAPDGSTFDPWHAYAPADFCAAYNIDKLHAEGITGAGQTIVIVELWGSPTALEDLQAFSQAFGLPAPDLTVVSVNGTPAFSMAQQGNQIGWAQETSLDLQWAHAVAPDAKLVLILSHSGVDNALKGVSYAVEHYPGSPISQSWGQAEQVFESAADVLAAKYGEVYRRAASARCSVLSACSDDGSRDVNKQGQFYPFPVVDWPASDPFVTAVGGTWLQYGWRWAPLISMDSALGSGDLFSYLNSAADPGGRTEAVWKEDWMFLIAGASGGTGGGLSALFATPDFQQGLPQSLLQGRRGVPDLSCNAAADGGVLVYYSGGWAPQPFPGPWGLAGGTSAATPELAGMVALVNQLRAQKGKLPIGYLNPVLYTVPARVFNDIVPQSFGEGPGVTVLDDNIPFGSDIPGFKTTTGYDLTTGLGSPNAYWFVHDLADTP